ncbi:phosphoadenosine phosphosulfate reductase domain-containing protein [Niallia sp. FSL R7-0271]|uniref:phosphoadenosine phosphosulfate reductase domain-containing protein n=1 Tax=Niallia sp. FSL R7-0271 TaxID=2921678 RepID=UPI0030F5694C
MDIFEQVKAEMKRIYLMDNRPIVILFSGGKDSSLVLSLTWQMLMDLPIEERNKKVHIMTSETGVETPVMRNYIASSLDKIEQKAVVDQLPIEVHRVQPDMKDNFFVRTLGRGNLLPTPKTKTRSCTYWLKINPTNKKIKELIAAAPIQLGNEHLLTAWIGVRDEESARRRASINKHAVDKESYYGKHAVFKEILCFSPIRFITSDELWFYLLQDEILPFGVSLEELTTQYGEGVLECSVKSEEGKTCGGSANARNGCWTCGMISQGKDPMLQRYISDGYNYLGLLEWKNLMLSMRNDIRYRETLSRPNYKAMLKQNDDVGQIDLFNINENTKYANQFETFKRIKQVDYSPGGLTFEGRKLLLEHLLFISKRDNLVLISEDEIMAILDAWIDTEGISIQREKLRPKRFNYDGELVFLPNKTINKLETKTTNPIFYINIEFNMEEAKLYSFLKERQITNHSSIFFFPTSQEFTKEKLVWNKATFVVCKESCTTRQQAYEHVYSWLGWEYGHFTEETQKAAIQFLMISAISDGLNEKYLREKREKIEAATIPTTSESDGQLVFEI